MPTLLERTTYGIAIGFEGRVPDGLTCSGGEGRCGCSDSPDDNGPHRRDGTGAHAEDDGPPLRSDGFTPPNERLAVPHSAQRVLDPLHGLLLGVRPRATLADDRGGVSLYGARQIAPLEEDSRRGTRNCQEAQVDGRRARVVVLL